jgi:hypothetical protein
MSEQSNFRMIFSEDRLRDVEGKPYVIGKSKATVTARGTLTSADLGGMVLTGFTVAETVNKGVRQIVVVLPSQYGDGFRGEYTSRKLYDENAVIVKSDRVATPAGKEAEANWREAIASAYAEWLESGKADAAFTLPL